MSDGRDPEVGWLSSYRTGDQWPGVLLHRDAFLVHADPALLREPPGDLVVQVGGAPRTVDEILLIDESAVDGRATAMVRLDGGVESVGPVVVDRGAVTRAWTEGRSLWPTLRESGVVPDSWPEPTGPVPAVADRPATIGVKSVTATPEDWCTIFWWLC